MFKPTRLYIKRHSITSKYYFGKTVRQNVKLYHGSGKHWVNHIKKYGTQFVETIWVSDWFYDQNEVTKKANLISEFLFIVESDQWLNMIIETGIGGGDDNHMVSMRKHKTVFSNKAAVAKIKEIMKDSGGDIPWRDKINKNPEKIRKTKEKNTGQKRPEEVKQKFRECNTGERNPAYGKIWINDGKTNRFINPNLLDIHPGFIQGRIMNRTNSGRFTQ